MGEGQLIPSKMLEGQRCKHLLYYINFPNTKGDKNSIRVKGGGGCGGGKGHPKCTPVDMCPPCIK